MSRFIPNSFQIPNSFVDEYLDSLSGKAIKCYLLIARKTTGWRKDSDRISTSQFMAQCGIKDRKTAYAAIEELESVNLVKIERKQGEINEFSLNFFIDENNDFKPVPKNGTSTKKSTEPVPKNGTSTKKSTEPVPKNGTGTSTKNWDSTKDNIKNNIQNNPPISPQGESAMPANGKINAENIPLPDYVDRETWIAYCRMRKAKRKEIQTEDTINRCLRDLEKHSGGNPDLARAILDQSIANTYIGLFPPKPLLNRTVAPSAINDPFADNGTWGVGRKLNIDPSLIPEYLR
ncbi:replication protein [Rodentibacter pneumotropicus]|uniref:replication protein n=1 Tax=Rodentibacter pneumotropicus TaxID=758 RepID=UPI001EE17144|nr:replication protein [Rodentibacter pneumotropicus]